MDMETLSFKPSTKMLVGELLKEFFIVLICLVCLYLGIRYKKQVFHTYEINTILFSIFDIPIGKLIFVMFADLIYIISFLALSKLLYKCFNAIYKANTTIEINLSKAKYKIESVVFPFSSVVEEGTIDQIIEVDICQTFIARLLNCGHIYLEYLVYSKTGARAKTLCIPYVVSPFSIKNKLLK